MEVIRSGIANRPTSGNPQPGCIQDIQAKICNVNLDDKADSPYKLTHISGSGGTDVYGSCAFPLYTGSRTPSLCDSNNVCTEMLSLLNFDSSTFDTYFTAVDGYHVGPHEYQGYFPQQVEFVNKGKSDDDPSYWKLSAVPSSEFPCIGRGDVNSGNRAQVSLGTCTYRSGAFYSYRKGFYVNRDSHGNTIDHGGIEIRMRVRKGNSDLTINQLYQMVLGLQYG